MLKTKVGILMLEPLFCESVVNSLDQPLFVKDLESKYIFVNEAYANIFCEDSAVILTKDDHNFFSKDDQFIIESQKSTDTKEKIFIDGVYKTFRVVKKPYYKNANIIGIVGVLLDITDYEVEKNNLKKLEDGLSKAQQLANIGHWELDLVENQLFWSDEVYRIFGLKVQEFGATYEAFLKHIHPDDIELVNNTYNESVKNKQGYNVTHRIIRKNGEIGFVEERCLHELNTKGEVIRSIGTVHDITKIKQVENDLMLAKNVFENMHDSVIITDSKQNIVSVNEAFTKLTGYNDDEVIGNNPRILSSGWHDDTFYKTIWDEVSKNGQWEGEIVDRKKNGKTFTSELKISSVFNEEGTLTNYLAISSDISRKKEQEKLIHNLAYFDSLTDLPNRILFEERVSSRLPICNRNSQKMAIFFIDMDNFKNVNDTLGHSYGDEFLIEVSKRIKSVLQEQDTLARQGGDEFTVLIEDIDSIENIAQVAQKIVEVFQRPLYLDSCKVLTSVSMGISIYPDDGQNYNELMKAADTAMYQVKATGKKHYQFYRSSMNEAVLQRINIENNLHNSIENNELFLEYQPKVDTKNNKVYGMEALVRWQQPEQGLIRPDQFISVAEDTGQIYDIGLWVFKQAIFDLKEFHKLDNTLIMSINISSKQLENEKFVSDISALVEEVGIAEKYIELEITESHIMDNIQKALLILKEIDAKGFHVSIDDFGTGYSSLSYLKSLPAHTIKIDRSFVLDIVEDEDDRSIVASIIAMANALGKDVIAEGSETQGHVDTLAKLMCHKIQGYYFSKPLRIEKFKEYLHNFNSQS